MILHGSTFGLGHLRSEDLSGISPWDHSGFGNLGSLSGKHDSGNNWDLATSHFGFLLPNHTGFEEWVLCFNIFCMIIIIHTWSGKDVPIEGFIHGFQDLSLLFQLANVINSAFLINAKK